MRRRVSPDAVAAPISPLPRNSDEKVETFSYRGSRNSSPCVDPAVRRASKAADSGKIEYSKETADSKFNPAGVDHLNKKHVETCSFHNSDPTSEHDESIATPGISLPHNVNLTPLGLNQKVANSRQQTRTSGRPVGRSMQPARSVRFDMPSISSLPTLVPSVPLKDMQCTNPRPRCRGSISETMHKSISPTSLSNRLWEHDRADLSLKLLPQKRPSDQDISIIPKKEKKPRLEGDEGFSLDKQINELIQGGIQQGKRAKQLPDRGNGHKPTAEYEKIRRLSNQRNEMRSQVLGKPHRPPSASTTPAGPNRDRLAAKILPQVSSLPQSSPLNNVINSATLNEEIVQTRIKFNLAEKDLIDEKAKRGTASRAISARVTALNKKLAALHRKRTEINNDLARMNSFRRCDLERYRPDTGAMTQTTPKGSLVSPLSPPDSEWKNRLSLCYEALQRTKLDNNNVRAVNRQSETLSEEDNPVIAGRKLERDILWRVEAAEDKVFPIPSRRQVHFALTDIETCL